MGRKSISGTEGRSAGNFVRADNNTQSVHREAITRLSGPEYEDGTYDLNGLTPVSYDSGYQVTFCQVGDNYSDTEYAGKVNEFLSASSDGIVSAGKFGTPEISFHVDNRRQAIRLAKKYNQISVWDWANQTEIKTGGTGERSS